MATKAKQKREERRKVSSKKMVENHERGWSSNTIKLPEGASFFNPNKELIYKIDIIPYIAGKGNKNAAEGEPSTERKYYVHRDVGPNQEQYICPAMTFRKPCPICNDRAKMERDPDADKEAVKALRPKERQLWNVIDLEHPEKGVQIWDISSYLFGRYLVDKIEKSDPEDNLEFFADPQDGKYLRLAPKEENMAGRKFLDFKNIEFKNRKQPYDDSIFDDSHNLDDMLVETPFDELKKAYEGNIVDEDDDEDDDDLPAPKKGVKKPAPAPIVDEDEDEDEDDLPAPPKKGSKAKPAPVDDDDEGDDSEPPLIGRKVTYKGQEYEVIKVNTNGTFRLEDEDGEILKEVAREKTKFVAEDDEDEEDDLPPKKGSKPTPAPVEDDDEDDDEEDDLPPPAKKPTKKPAPIEDDDEEDDEDDLPAPPKKGGKAKPSPIEDDDEDEPEDFEDDDEEDDDLPAPPKKKGKK